jgi:hypothetical protein
MLLKRLKISLKTEMINMLMRLRLHFKGQKQAQETHKAEQLRFGAMDANAQQGPEDMMVTNLEEFAGEQPQMAPEEAEATPWQLWWLST